MRLARFIKEIKEGPTKKIYIYIYIIITIKNKKLDPGAGPGPHLGPSLYKAQTKTLAEKVQNKMGAKHEAMTTTQFHMIACIPQRKPR